MTLHRSIRAATLVGALCGLACPTGAQVPATGSGAVGIVFLDRNRNGIRDAGERGMPGVPVSNQDAVTVSDQTGAFRLPAGGYGVVFVSVPDGYRAVGTFWRPTSSDAPLAFALAPVGPTRGFTFVHASDTHVSEQSLPRLQRLRALVDSLRPAFVLITGDLVRDALRVGETEARGYYELFEREARRFTAPVYTAPGNHEIFGIERHRSGVAPTHALIGRGMYRHYRGPDYYSFTKGGVHFVALNTVDIHDGQWYHGGVDSVQIAWLRRDLAHVPPGMPVVTYDHIPFFSTMEIVSGFSDEPPAPTLITIAGRQTFRHTVWNAREVLAVLRTRNHVLALGGHVHARELLRYEIDGVSVRFEQSAATVAPTEAAGLRFPSGLTLYTVRDGRVDAGRFVPLDR